MEQQKDGKTKRQTDGRTDRTYFIGPFQLTPGVQKQFEIETVLIQ